MATTKQRGRPPKDQAGGQPKKKRKGPRSLNKAEQEAKYIRNENIAMGITEAPKGKPGPKNFGQEHVRPGDNARYLRFALASWNLPPIDISDPVQVQNRIQEYFSFCIENDRKPNIVGVANWLGVSRETLNTWKRGDYRSATHSDLIQKTVLLMEEQWVDYMQNGKINPASGIFLAKNMFGYKDVQDVVVTPNNPLGEGATEDQIRARIEGSIAEED